MTSQNLLQGRKQRQSLLAQRREIASDAAEVQSPTPTAETAGDLLLHLDHTNIALGLRVIKRNTQIPYKGQDRLFVLDEAVKQIARRALLAPPAPCGGRFVRWRGRIGLLSQCQHLPIPAEHLGLQIPLQLVSSSGSGPVGQAKKGQQQAPHLRRPDLPGRFFQEDQLAQEMDIAERMSTPIALVGGPAIMDARALIAWQDPVGIQGLGSACGVDLVMGEPAGRGHMHPDPFASHVESSFILMNDGSLPKRDRDLLLDGLQGPGTARDALAKGSFAQMRSRDLRKDLSGSFEGQQMKRDQIDRQGLESRSILDGCRHRIRKRRPRLSSTMRAAFSFGLVLRDMQPCRRQIPHLPTFDRPRGYRSDIGLARCTHLDALNHNLIGMGNQRQMMPVMSNLSSGLLPAAFALAFGLLLPSKAVGGGGQMAVVTVFGQPGLQFFDSPGQLRNLGGCHRQRFKGFCQLCSQFLILLSERLLFFFGTHASSVPCSQVFSPVLRTFA